MNRLQKKCIIVATAFHLLLVLVLIVGPAFLPTPKSVNVPELNFIPVKTVDSLMSGGGNPKAAPPPPSLPAPPQPVQQPPVQAALPTPPPPKAEPVRTVEPDPPKIRIPDLTADPKPVKHQIKIDTKVVTRNNSQVQVDTKRAADEQARELAREQADKRRQIATAIGSTVSSLQNGLSPSTAIELQGPGGGGVPYGNWLQAVQKVYTEAWVVPDGVTEDLSTVTVTVTIARDGKVISGSVTRSSRNGVVNQSVEAVLNRVRYAPPLPDGAKESERTVTINFNLKVKLIG